MNSLISWNIKDDENLMKIEANKWQYKNSAKLSVNKVEISSFEITKNYETISFPKISKTYQFFTLNPIHFGSIQVIRIPNIR